MDAVPDAIELSGNDDDTGAEGCEGSSTAGLGGSKRGHKENWTWEYYDKVPGSFDTSIRRWTAKCKLCPGQAHTIKNARPHQLSDHLAKCKGVTPEILRAINEKSSHTDPEGLDSTGGDKRSAKKKLKQSNLAGHVNFLQKLDDITRRKANTKLMLFAAKCNIPFTAFDSQPFFEFCQLLCKDYFPPGV